MPFRADGRLRCPHCDGASLSPQTVQWIPRHACSACDGAWFDHADLLELARDLGINEGIALDTATSAEQPRVCPRCDRPMHALSVTDGGTCVVVDACVEHGVWFDRDELAPVLDAVMAQEDRARSPFDRTNRPWWAATLSFIFTALGNQQRPIR